MLSTATKLTMLAERYRSETEKIFVASLKDALEIISGKLSTYEDKDQLKRLNAIKRLVEEEIGTLYKSLKIPIQQDMQGFAEISHETIFDALNKETELGYAFAALPKDTMKEIISMTEVRLIGDKAYTLNEMFDGASNAQINRYKQIISGGLASNDGYRNITKRLKDANAKATTDMGSIVRTVISSARNKADEKAYKQFEDVITYWESIAVLDSRVTFLCASLDGKKYYVSAGYKTLSDVPYPIPRHWNCRSSIVGRTSFKTDTTRASNGDDKKQIDSKTKFPQWFAAQSSDFQEEYLGKSRYDLYKTERLTIKDFIDIKSGDKFTLEEIKKMLK